MKSYERLVNRLASMYASDGVDTADLRQEAWVAILENEALYREDMGVSKNTFLGRRIRDRLDKYVASTLNLVEVDRNWVAESIAGGPGESIKAKTKDECETLRQYYGEAKFAKPKRVIERAQANVSFDEGWDDVDPDNDSAFTRHEVIGVPAPQETALLDEETKKFLELKVGSGWIEVFQMKVEGLTFDQIAEKIGRPSATIRQMWNRAQKRLSKKKAA